MTVEIYTDGACSGNPGKGGAAAILLFNGHEKKVSQGYKKTTNNRMELRGAILGLQTLTRKVDCKIYTDSEYVQKGISMWINGWKARNWKTKAGQDVKNKDLWILLDSECQKHNCEFQWVKAHAGNKYNEMVDQLAVNAMYKTLKDDKVE